MEDQKITPPVDHADHGKRHASWVFPEFEDHNRGRRWYIIASIILVGIIIYGIASANYLFAVFFALAAFVYAIRIPRKPRLISLAITEDGLEVHETFYAYKDLEKFWIVYEPPEVKTLYITFTSKIRPLLTIPLESQNPLVIREILLRYLKEDLERDEELLSDVLQRKLKL
ncbi:MAG: hypothetical protein WC495_03260 [Patescibacteria group bacterium]|jgi:hypothetical protein